MENRIVKNKLVARINNEYYFCNELFQHSKDFKGATGTVLVPITEDELDERWDNYDWEDQWKMAVENGNTTDGLDAWVNSVEDNDGKASLLDDSGSNLYQQLRDIGITEEEFPYFDCVGGGRCFDKDVKYDQVYDQKLLDEIISYES